MHPYLDGPYPRAFAHRGWHVDELSGLENSLRSFRRAVAEGYAYLETDVHATADGVAVLHHDHTLDRTTDGRGAVAAHRWSALRAIRINGAEPVCTLAELLEELPEIRINIDVKDDAAVSPVLDVLRRAGAWERVCLAAFSDRRLARLRAGGGPRLLTSLGPRAAAALRLRSWAARSPGSAAGRAARSVQAGRPTQRGRPAQLPRRYGRLTVIDRALLRHAHRLGTEVHAWTVDTAEEMVELLELGVDGLVTDRPEVLRAVLRERGAWPGG